jgi:glucosamine-6-phosphate deaminase
MDKIITKIHDNAIDASQCVAAEIVSQIHHATKQGNAFVLGLATGSTPLGVYNALIEKFERKEVSFKNVFTFNLDEYYGIAPDHPESYRSFMDRHLFSRIDILPHNTIVPDGLVERNELSSYCKWYEERISKLGGIDVQLLGIGRTGHIGFNEPGSTIGSLTRLVQLDDLTREDASRDFLGKENVPLYALTMGIKSILNARKIYLLAWGKSKAPIVSRALEGPPTHRVPASLLQEHNNIEVFLDQPASSELKKVKQPWLSSGDNFIWNESLVKHAVSLLALQCDKPMLKLLDQDYSEHGLSGLLAARGPAHRINIDAFNAVQHTISGWPGGKPDTDDKTRPERSSPFPKKILFFAPEPQDTCLSTGATIQRLVQQGHDLRIIVMTSGKNSVPDGEAEKYFSFSQKMHILGGLSKMFFDGNNYDALSESIKGSIKASLRRAETISALKILGVMSDKIEFIELPFYENGRERNYNVGMKDYDILESCIIKTEPHQIFITGKDLEPSSIQSLCYRMTRDILIKYNKEDWNKNCLTWIYESEKQIFDTGEIDMAVPMSPLEYANKSKAVFQHHSQQDQTPPIMSEEKATWPLASRSDRLHAKNYDSLGLAEYEAIETFIKMK